MEINQAVRWLLLSGSLLLALLLGWWLWSDSETDRPDLLEKVPVFEFPLIGRSGVVPDISSATGPWWYPISIRIAPIAVPLRTLLASVPIAWFTRWVGNQLKSLGCG